MAYLRPEEDEEKETETEIDEMGLDEYQDVGCRELAYLCELVDERELSLEAADCRQRVYYIESGKPQGEADDAPTAA